jgi:hypothetical protein
VTFDRDLLQELSQPDAAVQDSRQLRIHRIAIIATCKRRKKIVLDYGDMDVWGLKINDKSITANTVLAPKKDIGYDKLIDVSP